MKLNFNISSDLTVGVTRLSDVLGYTQASDGVTVKDVKGDKIGVSFDGQEAVIYYKSKPQFYRGLSILIEKGSEPFECFESDQFDTLGVMLDTSRCAALNMRSLYKFTDYLAVMGYNMIWLYVEDSIVLSGRPYFGYMRPKYTEEELSALDDYAYEYGIEVVPCLECYGHMAQYLKWPEASSIKDTDSVLLAREPKTFQFLDELISTVARSFRSRRIHIGMDEAWDMGRGKFLDRHGYVPPAEIFNEYMNELTKITDKYGLRPMMWSDMYFRTCSVGNHYYEKDIVIPDSVKQNIPKDIDLVFWHYGEMPGCDGYMLEKHMALDRPVIFAGGLWSWIGHFPEHNYALETTRFSIDACRSANVKEAVMTIWLNDNAECDVFANLYGLSFMAELVYDENPSAKKLKERFEASTGASADAFYKMSYYHNKFDGVKYDHFSQRFLGKPLFWQDILEGLYDYDLLNCPMSEHYIEAAESISSAINEDDRWNYLYVFAKAVFEYMSLKCYVAENLTPAYKSGDKEMLYILAKDYLPAVKESCEEVHSLHKKMWFENNKPLGWGNMDIRYGGVAARCDTAQDRIFAYLSGEIDKIEELEEPRLYKSHGGFLHYSAMSSPNLKI